MVNKLKHKFNQLFDDLFMEKQRQLDNLKEYNERLRIIETELRLACKSINAKQTSKNSIIVVISIYFV